MKKIITIFTITLILSSCVGHTPKMTSLSDNEISDLIIGKWAILVTDNDLKWDAIDDYLPDGRVIQKGMYTYAGLKKHVYIISKWKIENGKLISTLLTIKPEGLIPVGYSTTDSVISINNKKFLFRDDKTGELRTYKRVNRQ